MTRLWIGTTIWLAVLGLSFLLGVSFGLFVLSYNFAIATWDKAMTVLEDYFYIGALSYATPITIAVFTALAVVINYFRRRSLSQLFSDFRLGDRGTLPVTVCLLAIIAIVYVLAQVVHPEYYLSMLVAKLYNGFYTFYNALLRGVVETALGRFGSLAVLMFLLTIYIFFMPLLVKTLAGLTARDISTGMAIATGLGIMIGAAEIPLAETALNMLNRMYYSMLTSLGVFGSIIAVILLLVSISELRRIILQETRVEYLVHLPVAMLITVRLADMVFGYSLRALVGYMLLVGTLLLFAIFFIGIAFGKQKWAYAAAATFPMLLYVSLA